MNEDAYLDLAALAGDVDLVVIGAGNPAAMMRLTEQCRARQIPFANDTSQQLATFDGDQIRDLVAGAAYLFCNDYEASLIEHKTGWSDAELTAQVGVRVTTLGSAGARVDRPGQEPVLVGPVKDVSPADPTGAGDAFRAGFLAAVAWGRAAVATPEVVARAHAAGQPGGRARAGDNRPSGVPARPARPDQPMRAVVRAGGC